MARPETPPFERFTERARQVIVLAQEEARALKHNYIGTEHLLLGLLTAGGISQSVLDSLGVDPRRVRETVVRIVGRGEEQAEGQIPFTPRVKGVLMNAAPEAEALGHQYVGSEHVLLSLVSENEGVAARILLDFEVTPDLIRDAVLVALGNQGRDSDEPRRGGAAGEQGQSAEEAQPEDAASSQLAEEEPESEPEPAAQEEPEPLETVPTLGDRPAHLDEFGRAQLAEILGERIRRARGEDTEVLVDTRSERGAKLRRDRAAARRTGSFMVHLYAPWGAGKSSLLNFLATEMRNRAGDTGLAPHDPRRLAGFFRRREPADPGLSQWIVAEFSAWEHQRLVAPWWWLLTEVQRACGRELWQIHRGRWLWFWIRDLTWRLWNARAAVIALLVLVGIVIAAWTMEWFGLPDESLTDARTILLTVTTALALGGSVFGLIRGTSKWLAIGSAEGAVRFLRRAHDPLGVYRRRFRWLVRSSGRPITVFIDDLDRCRPAYVVELLEGIQTLFAKEPVAYVVAADRNWLCESFARSYSEFENSVGNPGRPLGFLFLEKTFQISQEIPPMSESDRERYWARLLSGAGNGFIDHDGAESNSAHVQVIEDLARAATQADMNDGVREFLDRGGIADEDEVLQAVVRRLNAPDMQEQLERLLSEFTPLLENNPRAMKRLINAYGVERDRLLRAGHILSRDQRRQLALLTILRLRWPLFADHLRQYPNDAKLFRRSSAGVPADHPFGALYKDPEVKRLFDGTAGERLDPAHLTEFPSPATLRTPRYSIADNTIPAAKSPD